MPAAAYVYRANPARLQPLLGGADVLFSSGGTTPPATPSYPPSYGVVGSYRPAAGTAGVPTGTKLTQQLGNMTLSTPGQVIQDLDIHGKVSITAANVTIRRCIIRGTNGGDTCVAATNAAVSGAVIEDCLIVPEFPSRLQNGISGHDFTVRRCEFRDCVDYIGLWNTAAVSPYQLNVTVEANYMHDMTYFSPDAGHADNQTHNDGIQIQGGLGAVIRGNSIEAYYGPNGSAQPDNLGPTPTGDTSPSLSCLLFNNNVGVTGSHVIEDNWLLGGYVPVNCGGAPGRDLGRMWRNKFSGDSAPGSGGIPQTILLTATQTCDTGDGTANQNVFDNSAQPVLVRHNG